MNDDKERRDALAQLIAATVEQAGEDSAAQDKRSRLKEVIKGKHE